MSEDHVTVKDPVSGADAAEDQDWVDDLDADEQISWDAFRGGLGVELG